MTTTSVPPMPVENGRPGADPAAYRRCLGQFATGIAVVTAVVDGERVGMTANSFSSVSLDPPLVLWSPKRASASFPVFEQATHFAINILGQHQVHLSRHFGRTGPDKFDGIGWTAGIGDVPLLDGCLASLECRRVADHPGGDHLIMIGEVERFARYEMDPLLYVKGRYGVVHPTWLPDQSAGHLSIEIELAECFDGLDRLLGEIRRAGHPIRQLSVDACGVRPKAIITLEAVAAVNPDLLCAKFCRHPSIVSATPVRCSRAAEAPRQT